MTLPVDHGSALANCRRCGIALRPQSELQAELAEAGRELCVLTAEAPALLSQLAVWSIQEHAETVRVATAQLQRDCGEH